MNANVHRRTGKASCPQKRKPGHAPVFDRPLDSIYPSPENDLLYRTVDPSDPEFKALVASVGAEGVHQPLVVTTDDYILSGHRRYAAARQAGRHMVPCQVYPIARATTDKAKYLRLLREHNRQRDKSLDEKLREELVCLDPVDKSDAYRRLLAHRERAERVQIAPLAIVGKKTRHRITEAKRPFLNAIKTILTVQKAFWPLTDRQIHYLLLNDPPLKHAAKPDSLYANDKPSYKSLTDLLTRARLAKEIPMQAIADGTRSTWICDVYADVQSFIRSELDGCLKNYWRDLMRSQPCHVEILVEKNTVASFFRDIAYEYCIPITSARGHCSLPPRNDMAQRFKRSGKSKLIVLIASDFDPDGEEIAHAFARSMRDDFGIDDIVAHKVALTSQQIADYSLPRNMKAKRGSSQYKKFVAAHGEFTYELEALPPAELQSHLRSAIESVIDLDAYHAEQQRELGESDRLERARHLMQTMLPALLAAGNNTDNEEE